MNNITDDQNNQTVDNSDENGYGFMSGMMDSGNSQERVNTYGSMMGR